MDEIENLQNKDVTVSQLKELINKCGKQLHQVRQEEDQLTEENEANLEELVSKITAMKGNLLTEHQVLEQKNKELLKYNDSVVKLKAEHDKCMQEKMNLEIQTNILKTAKPNQQDQILLEQGRTKLHLYRELTGIHWDYSAIKESTQGYVSNKRDYIHHFCFTKDEKDSEELSNYLWNEIYLSIENMLNEDIKDSSILKN